MTIESTLSVGDTNVVLNRVMKPGQQYVDFEVRDARTDAYLGRCWQVSGPQGIGWAAAPPGAEHPQQFGKMLDGLEHLVKAVQAQERAARLHFNPEATKHWALDGKWHRVLDPMPIVDPLFATLVMNTCGNGDEQPFGEPLPEGTVSMQWDGHNPFGLVVKFVETWTWHTGTVDTDDKGRLVDEKGNRVRRYEDKDERPGPRPVRWEHMVGVVPFVVGYRFETC